MMTRREFIKAIGVLAAVPLLPTVLKPTFADFASRFTYKVEWIAQKKCYLAYLYGKLQDGEVWQAADFLDFEDVQNGRSMRDLKKKMYQMMYRCFIDLERDTFEIGVLR